MAAISIKASNLYNASSSSLVGGEKAYVVNNNTLSQQTLISNLYNNGKAYLNNLETLSLLSDVTTYNSKQKNCVFNKSLAISDSQFGEYNIYVVILDTPSIETTNKIYITNTSYHNVTSSSYSGNASYDVTTSSQLPSYPQTTTFVDTHWYDVGEPPTPSDSIITIYKGTQKGHFRNNSHYITIKKAS